MFGFMNHFLMGCPQGIQTCLAFETSFWNLHDHITLAFCMPAIPPPGRWHQDLPPVGTTARPSCIIFVSALEHQSEIILEKIFFPIHSSAIMLSLQCSLLKRNSYKKFILLHPGAWVAEVLPIP
jgi:hypothetical protein